MAVVSRSDNNNPAGGAPQVEVRLFGAFELHRGGQQTSSIHYDKVRALLAYLVLEPGREHRRIALASMLWPDVPDTKALGSLRQCLTQLRQALGEDQRQQPLIKVERHTLCFIPTADFQCDALLLSAPQSRVTDGGDLSACHEWLGNRRYPLAHYSRPLLEGLRVPGCDLYDAWLEQKREYYHRYVLSELHQAIRCAEAVGALEEALDYSWLVLTHEPWDEHANGTIIRLHADKGERTTALRHFDHYSQGLRKELGAEPDPAIHTLYRRIREGGR